MNLSTHHKLALAGAVVTSGLAVTDAVTHGLTGHYSWFSDDSDVRLAQLLGALAHGLTYAALCLVLVREAARIRTAGRPAAVVRWVLVVSLAVLSVGFVLVAPFATPESGPLGAAFGVLAGGGFAGMILGSLVIGPMLLRQPELRTASRVLSAMIPVLGATILLGFAAPDWAHPAYLETTLHFGIALMGVDAVRRQPLSEWPVERRFSQASTTRAAMPASADLPHERGS